MTLRELKRMTEPDGNGCWNYTRSKSQWGYATKFFNGKNVILHRYTWELVNGEIPKGMCICHRCDNKKCINPDHLFMGTQKDNIQDMIRKGRYKLNKQYTGSYKFKRPDSIVRFNGTGRWLMSEQDFNRFIHGEPLN